MTYKEIAKREKDDGFVSGDESDGGPNYNPNPNQRVPVVGDLLEVEVEEDDATGWRIGQVRTRARTRTRTRTRARAPNPNPSPSPEPEP